MISRIFSKNKLSISLLSCLVLIVMNTHAKPPIPPKNTSTKSYILPNSYIHSKNGAISDDGWGTRSDDSDDSDIPHSNINLNNQLDSSAPIHERRKHLHNHLIKRYKYNGDANEKSNLYNTQSNQPVSSDKIKEDCITLFSGLLQSSKSHSTPKPTDNFGEGSDVNNTERRASFNNAREALLNTPAFAPTKPMPPVQVPLSPPPPPPKPAEQALSVPSVSTNNLNNTVENTEDSEYNVTSTQELNIGASHAGHIIKNIYNSGNIIFSKGGKSGDDLIIAKNYIGNNGFIKFNPTVVKNNMTLNRFIIKGNSSGLTNVSINNIGGTNSASLNGLELIHVDGLSEGIFNQSGRIVAGAYDYSLVRGHDNNRGNWYLTNQQLPIIDSNKRIERPEAASYIANLSASNTLFTTTLSDRLGETQFTDRLTGEKKVTSLWLRQVGNHDNWYDSNNQLKTQSKSYVTMLGGDVMKWTSNGHRRGRLGLMAGYGNNSSNSRSSITNYHSKGSVKGYSVGSYATWFANNTDKSGLYVDGWIQYNWLNNHVQGQGLPKENYTSKGINAAIETGYTIKVDEFIKHQGMVEQWFIQPQAQITKMGVKAKKHREANGTHVISGGKGHIQTRLGIRTYLKGQHAMNKYKNREFEPFIEANWLHNTRNFKAALDGDNVSQAGTRNIGEVKIGAAGKINSKVNIWGNIGTQVADKGYSNTSVTIGVKYNF